MPVDLSKKLVIGVSSSALFDMSEADEIFRRDGLAAYREFQERNADIPLPPGTGFPLIRAVLQLNAATVHNPKATRKTEVVVASKNSPSTCRRLYNSIKFHGLDDIQRSFLSGGAAISQYLHAFSVDLFLSTSPDDVEAALKSDIPAALIYHGPAHSHDSLDQIRVAFDGDNVLFSNQAEDVYQRDGFDAFVRHETEKADVPLPPGPFAPLLRVLSFLQQDESFRDRPPVRVALVTARNMPTHDRVLKTLESWKVRVDEAFFMGGVDKTPILKAFKPHVYFDDQVGHCERAASVVPTARVPSISGAADATLVTAPQGAVAMLQTSDPASLGTTTTPEV